MPKKTPIEDQFGAYEDPPDLDAPKPKQKNFGGMPDKGSYEKVATDDKAEAPPAASSAGYPRSIPFTNCGPYLTNYVSTTKYSRFTFLPLATIAQYKRAANVYLLFIAVLCCIPAISPLMPIAAVMPVVFVLTISLIREGAEDYARYKSDEDMNNKTTFVRNPASGQFEEVMWKDVHVGDMIKLADRDWIPTDVLMLTSSAEDGCAYIDTMDLDGETNLKRRTSPKVTTGLTVEDVGTLSGGHLQCAGPSGDLYRFDGALKISDGKSAAVSEQNMLLRSSRLRNTKWAVGVVIYTGMEAKVMLNSINAGKAKQSALEVIVNKAIMLIFVIQLCMAVLSAVLSGAWAASACGSHTYLSCSASGAGTASLTFWTYIILLNSLIPASLIVTMEIVKVVHASFINWDHTLVKKYDKKEEKWRGAEAHTSALNEGLGQIDYIFSDKTGTRQ
jgi:phospholipid-translocating ATPase